MTGIEDRLRHAAASARRAAERTDVDRLLLDVEGRPSRHRAWRVSAVAVAATAVVAAFVVLGSGLGSNVEVQDPLGPAPTRTSIASPTDTAPPPSTTCSAAGLPSTPEAQPELPSAVAALRAELAALAVSCDIDGLAAIAADQLSYSFGADDDPAGFWNRLEQEPDVPGDAKPLEALRRLLDTRPGTMQTASGGEAVYWTWPRLHLMEAGDPEQDAAVDEVVATGLYDRALIEEMLADHGAYLGYRIMIEVRSDAPDEATWVVFIAGD